MLLHQNPDRVENQLVPLLARRSALPVAATADGQRLQTGTVFVVPAGQHLVLYAEQGALCCALFPSGASPPSRPSADLLFASMATAVRERALAVVLSGYGHDGATGATAVSRFGGTVLASDAASSQVFSMPEATIERDDVVDHVAPVGELAGILARLVRED